MLSTKNLKQKRLNKKLFHKFIESFRIVEFIDKQTYRLLFLNIYYIHIVFHMSLLKIYKRKKCDDDKLFLFNSELFDDNLKYKIKKVLNKKTQNDQIYYKLKWTNWTENYKSWRWGSLCQRVQRQIAWC